MRSAHAKFEANGIKLYAVSYDDPKALREFAEAQGITYPLLSDQDSTVIAQYGILNTQVSPDDALIYGIPYPGVFVCDEDGLVVSKFFHDSYKKRESPEAFIDAALGHIQIEEEVPQTSGGDEGIAITAAVRGGNSSLRQGIIRNLVVRFALKDGLHLYGEPVPTGLTATQVTILGPQDLQCTADQIPADNAVVSRNNGHQPQCVERRGNHCCALLPRRRSRYRGCGTGNNGGLDRLRGTLSGLQRDGMFASSNRALFY